VERPVKAADAPGKLEALVKRILAKKPNAFVFVASLLPTNWSKNINPSLNERARALGERSATDRVFFVDMNQEARLVSGDWSDGLHPNASGNKKVAAVWSRALKSRLPK
jgi:lysophospholipase L1-like esterase